MDEVRDKAHKIIANGTDVIEGDFKRIGKLIAFTDDEYSQFRGILGLIERYIDQKTFTRPLCIGVFGPPGSGKSFSVEQIVNHAVAEMRERIDDEEFSMPLQTFNLTQIPSSHYLSELVGHSMVPEESGVPVLFFDEFDAPLDGSPLGWLSWFLAPMHDGHFQLRGTTIPLRRAVYVFAGGTSSSFVEFGNRDDTEFKNAKGPDFVSRLRGVLDVKGPNERESRDHRRAIILWNALKKRRKSLLGEGKVPLRMVKDLREGFLDAGRFRHGARSIGAVVEMCSVRWRKDKQFNHLAEKDLPERHLLQIHVDRGPLDPAEIGGAIGLSAGDERVKRSEYEKAWRKVARALWEQGASIVYGGHAGEKGFTQLLRDETEKLPRGVLHPGEANSSPYLRWVVTSEKETIPRSIDKYVSVEAVPELVFPDRRDLNARISEAPNEGYRDWLKRSLLYHRLRRQMNRQSVGRVVFRGKIDKYSGRMPGILEETLLSLVSGKPVYVIGAFGGAAESVGRILGLDSVTTSRNVRDAFQMKESAEAIKYGKLDLPDFRDLFNETGGPPFPCTFGEAVDLLWEFAIGGRKWIENGLSRSENQELFLSKDPDRICSLLVLGLTRALGS